MKIIFKILYNYLILCNLKNNNKITRTFKEKKRVLLYIRRNSSPVASVRRAPMVILLFILTKLRRLDLGV